MDASRSVPELCHVLQTNLSNMEKALRCPLCLSTFKDPVLTPCMHPFCKPCIDRSLQEALECPQCRQPCSRRSQTKAPQLSSIAMNYKRICRAFGLAPLRYEETLAMTQLPESEEDLQVLQDGLLAAKVFQEAFQSNDWRRKQQEQVVEANQKALLLAQQKSTTQVLPTCSQIIAAAQEQATADAQQEWMEEEEEDKMKYTRVVTFQDELRGAPLCESSQETVEPEILQCREEHTHTVPTPKASNVAREAASQHRNGSNGPVPAFSIGSIVQVQSRTWPGINKPGGVGRVTNVHTRENGSVSYDIQYVLGGREINVDALFCTLGGTTVEQLDNHKDVARKSLRRRMNDIPMDLLLQLKEEGFDTGNALPLSTQSLRKENVQPTNRKRKADLTKDSAQTKRTFAQKIVSTVSKLLLRSTPPDEAQVPCLDTNSKDICRQADMLYKERIAGAMKKGVIQVAVSGLAPNDSDAVQRWRQACKNSRVKIQISEKFDPSKMTLCIVAECPQLSHENNLVAQKRTIKAMRSALGGVPMVSSQWVMECCRLGDIVLPSSNIFIRSLPCSADVGKESAFGVAKTAASLNADSSHRVLAGTFVAVFGSIPQLEASDVHLLLREAGAMILQPTSSIIAKIKSIKESKVVLICHGQVKLPKSLELLIQEKPKSVILVNAQWLFDSISCGAALSSAPYPPGSNQTKQLWSLTQSTVS